MIAAGQWKIGHRQAIWRRVDDVAEKDSQRFKMFQLEFVSYILLCPSASFL